MTKYKIAGIYGKTGKEYLSKKSFVSNEDALKWGYKQTYNKSGNTKRKTPIFHSWYIKKE